MPNTLYGSVMALCLPCACVPARICSTRRNRSCCTIASPPGCPLKSAASQTAVRSGPSAGSKLVAALLIGGGRQLVCQLLQGVELPAAAVLFQIVVGVHQVDERPSPLPMPRSAGAQMSSRQANTSPSSAPKALHSASNRGCRRFPARSACPTAQPWFAAGAASAPAGRAGLAPAFAPAPDWRGGDRPASHRESCSTPARRSCRRRSPAARCPRGGVFQWVGHAAALGKGCGRVIQCCQAEWRQTPCHSLMPTVRCVRSGGPAPGTARSSKPGSGPSRRLPDPYGKA